MYNRSHPFLCTLTRQVSRRQLSSSSPLPQLFRSTGGTMSTYSDPALDHLYSAVQQLTPLSLADTSWDNVGVLCEVPVPREVVKGSPKRVLCCIDLTPQVLSEALSSPSTSLLLTYHPPIFSGLKSLTLSTPLQRTLLTCIQQGLSILTIHTAADNALQGVNDYLAQSVFFDEVVNESDWKEQVKAIKEIKEVPNGMEGAGTGRMVSFKQGREKTKVGVVMALKKKLKLQYVQAAWSATGNDKIRTIAICAGSGSSVLKGVKADLYITGELGHHEILAANALGTHVILTNHSASERPWLSQFAPRLQSLMNQLAVESGGSEESYEVVVSKSDREPLQVV